MREVEGGDLYNYASGSLGTCVFPGPESELVSPPPADLQRWRPGIKKKNERDISLFYPLFLSFC